MRALLTGTELTVDCFLSHLCEVIPESCRDLEFLYRGKKMSPSDVLSKTKNKKHNNSKRTRTTSDSNTDSSNTDRMHVESDPNTTDSNTDSNTNSSSKNTTDSSTRKHTQNHTQTPTHIITGTVLNNARYHDAKYICSCIDSYASRLKDLESELIRTNKARKHRLGDVEVIVFQLSRLKDELLDIHVTLERFKKSLKKIPVDYQNRLKSCLEKTKTLEETS